MTGISKDLKLTYANIYRTAWKEDQLAEKSYMAFSPVTFWASKIKEIYDWRE